jgi:hypothetical protein
MSFLSLGRYANIMHHRKRLALSHFSDLNISTFCSKLDSDSNCPAFSSGRQKVWATWYDSFVLCIQEEPEVCQTFVSSSTTHKHIY